MAGQLLPVQFALGGASGTPIPDDLAQRLADGCAVRVTFAGDAECATYQFHERRVTISGSSAASGSRSVQIR